MQRAPPASRRRRLVETQPLLSSWRLCNSAAVKPCLILDPPPRPTRLPPPTPPSPAPLCAHSSRPIPALHPGFFSLSRTPLRTHSPPPTLPSPPTSPLPPHHPPDPTLPLNNRAAMLKQRWGNRSRPLGCGWRWEGTRLELGGAMRHDVLCELALAHPAPCERRGAMARLMLSFARIRRRARSDKDRLRPHRAGCAEGGRSDRLDPPEAKHWHTHNVSRATPIAIAKAPMRSEHMGRPPGTARGRHTGIARTRGAAETTDRNARTERGPADWAAAPHAQSAATPDGADESMRKRPPSLGSATPRFRAAGQGHAAHAIAHMSYRRHARVLKVKLRLTLCKV